MNTFVKELVIFALGCAVGSYATYKLISSKHEKMVQEEIESIRTTFANRKPTVKTEEVEPPSEEEVLEYANLAQKYTKNEVGRSQSVVKPYVISPEEFGEYQDYEQIELIYYANGFLVDDQDEEVDDYSIVPDDFVEHFGEYEDDSVFVRNDELRCDYEILLSMKRYIKDGDT